MWGCLNPRSNLPDVSIAKVAMFWVCILFRNKGNKWVLLCRLSLKPCNFHLADGHISKLANHRGICFPFDNSILLLKGFYFQVFSLILCCRWKALQVLTIDIHTAKWIDWPSRCNGQKSSEKLDRKTSIKFIRKGNIHHIRHQRNPWWHSNGSLWVCQ